MNENARDGGRLFVCEFITGGGCLGGALAPDLAAEGALMLEAVLKDLLALGRFDIRVGRDPRAPALNLPVTEVMIDADPWAAWSACLRDCDRTLLIAPETDGILERLSRLALEQGSIVLGCEPSAVAIAASKIATADRLAAHGIAVPATARFGDTVPSSRHGWVVKPDDGAGSEDTWFFPDLRRMQAWRPEAPARRRVIQAYVPGTPLSLSVLFGDAGAQVLGVNAQIVSIQGASLRQVGVIVNAHAGLRPRVQPLAEAVGRAVPGLRGYVGIDLIDVGSGDPVVIEINPRLTTAYAGLSASLGYNTAELLLQSFAAGSASVLPPRPPIPVTVAFHEASAADA